MCMPSRPRVVGLLELGPRLRGWIMERGGSFPKGHREFANIAAMSRSADETEERISCLWVFLPLPQPLGLPEGLVFQSERTADELLRFKGRALVRYSARVLQVRRTANVLGSDSIDVAQAIARVIDPTQSERTGDKKLN